MTAGSTPGVPGHSPLYLSRLVVTVLALVLVAAACGPDRPDPAGSDLPTLTISAIPDQDPEKLQRLYGTLVDYLGEELEVDVRYEPVADYTAAVNLFRVGDLDMVWFGGLTGVQARLQTPGARPLLQRDIDAEFRSVFVVHESTGLQPVSETADLAELRGLRFTFGPESSTSGRLMPQFFLESAGVDVDGDFTGPPGFSASHDATIALVSAGSYQAGAVNEQVWKSTVEKGEVDHSRVVPFYVTPTYHDYHWLVRPDLDDRFGGGFADRVVEAFTALSPDRSEGAVVLDLFGAESFIPATAEDYGQIEQIGRSVGLIR